jgi:hypothetical protein
MMAEGDKESEQGSKGMRCSRAGTKKNNSAMQNHMVLFTAF